MENKVIKVNRNAIAKGFNEKIPAAYKANLSKEKVKYAFAFCIKNNLNPAKNEVSLIFNKAGEAVPVVNYEYQLDKFGKLGYRHEYVYIPSVIDAIAIECIIFKGEKKIGSYIAYVDEWKGNINKKYAMTRIRSFTQALKEFVPELRHQWNNFEIDEVLKSQNKEFDENKIIENAKKDGKEINEEEVKNFVSASDLGEE